MPCSDKNSLPLLFVDMTGGGDNKPFRDIVCYILLPNTPRMALLWLTWVYLFMSTYSEASCRCAFGGK